VFIEKRGKTGFQGKRYGAGGSVFVSRGGSVWISVEAIYFVECLLVKLIGCQEMRFYPNWRSFNIKTDGQKKNWSAG